MGYLGKEARAGNLVSHSASSVGVDIGMEMGMVAVEILGVAGVG